MPTFPKTLLAFQEQFPDDDACWQTLRRMHWPTGFAVRDAGTARATRLPSGVWSNASDAGTRRP